MKISGLKNLIKEYHLFYLTAALLLVILKLLYRKADSDDLQWLLAPTARWVQTLSGKPFEYLSRIGYVNHELRFVIARSCSGFQFMLICAAALIFSFLHRIVPAGSPESENNTGGSGLFTKLLCGFGWIAAGFGLSYIITILVNTVRILLSIDLPPLLERVSLGGWLTPDRLHTLIGTVVYFASLLMIYQAADTLTLKLCAPHRPLPRIGSKAFFRFLQPAFWYFFFVLGIPVLTRAYRNGLSQFADYAILVTLAGSVLLALFTLAGNLRR